HVAHVLRACRFVQGIHVLRADEEPLADSFLELRERDMCAVGLALARLCAALRVEPPHERRVRRPTFGRCDVFDAMLLPKTTRVAKRLDAALGTDASPGEDEYGFARVDDERFEVGVRSDAHWVLESSLSRSRCPC